MLNRCPCGRYTNYGVSCALCVMNKTGTPESPELDLDAIVDWLAADEESDDPAAGGEGTEE